MGGSDMLKIGLIESGQIAESVGDRSAADYLSLEGFFQQFWRNVLSKQTTPWDPLFFPTDAPIMGAILKQLKF